MAPAPATRLTRICGCGITGADELENALENLEPEDAFGSDTGTCVFSSAGDSGTAIFSKKDTKEKDREKKKERKSSRRRSVSKHEGSKGEGAPSPEDHHALGEGDSHGSSGQEQEEEDAADKDGERRRERRRRDKKERKEKKSKKHAELRDEDEYDRMSIEELEEELRMLVKVEDVEVRMLHQKFNRMRESVEAVLSEKQMEKEAGLL